MIALQETSLPTSELQAWWLFCGMLVFFMQAGFMMYESGCVRDVNQAGISLKNFLMLLVSMAGFLIVGYRLAYGDSWHGMVGQFGTSVIDLPYKSSWLFKETGFAVIAATIMSGAMAGRSTLRSNVLAALAMTTIVYPIQAHWIWGDGWLATRLAVWDFAGSGVVHLVGGVAAAMGAWALGPRLHRSFAPPDVYTYLDRHGKERRVVYPRLIRIAAMKAHALVDGIDNDASPKYVPRISMKRQLGPRDLSLACYGLVLLMIGWMGFNGANVTETDPWSPLGFYFLTTCGAAIGGWVCVAVVEFVFAFMAKEPDEKLGSFLINPFTALTGAMGGMVAVTAVCADLDRAWEGFAVGGLGGCVAWGCSALVVRVNIDDPVDAVAIHAGGGAVGLLLVGPFRDGPTLWGQGIAVAVIIAFSGLCMLLVFVVLGQAEWLRCSEEDELRGLKFAASTSYDITPSHNEEAAYRASVAALEERKKDPCQRPPCVSPRFFLLHTMIIVAIAALCWFAPELLVILTH